MHLHSADLFCQSPAGRCRPCSLRCSLWVRRFHRPLPEHPAHSLQPVRHGIAAAAGPCARRRPRQRQRDRTAAPCHRHGAQLPPHPAGSAAFPAGAVRGRCILRRRKARAHPEPRTDHDRRPHRAGQRRSRAAQHGVRSGRSGRRTKAPCRCFWMPGPPLSPAATV